MFWGFNLLIKRFAVSFGARSAQNVPVLVMFLLQGHLQQPCYPPRPLQSSGHVIAEAAGTFFTYN